MGHTPTVARGLERYDAGWTGTVSDDAGGSPAGDAGAADDGVPATATTTRRDFGRVLLGGIGLLGGSGAGLLLTSGRSLALEADTWVVNGASAQTTCGQIDAVTFGDAEDTADDAIVVEYAGLNESGRELVLEVRVRGMDDGDADGWAGGAETGWATLATNTHTLDDKGGSLTMTWEEAFGEDQPVDVTAHPEIDIEDFEVDVSDEERVRTLEVELFAEIPDEGIVHSQINEADVTVIVDADPDIDVFELSDGGSNENWDRVDVEWAVSDPCLELAEVVTELRPEGETEVLDTATTAVDGMEADGVHELETADGDGYYDVVLTVTDVDGNAATETKPFTAEDAPEDGDTGFTVLTAEVTDTRGDESPRAVTFEYEIDTTEPHNILFTLEVDNDSTSELEEDVTAGTVELDLGGGQADEPTATVTANIDGGASCSADITVDDGQLSLLDPQIDGFELINTSDPDWDRVDVEWAVSHPCSELDEVLTELRPEGETEVLDTATTEVDGMEADGVHVLENPAGEGPYEVVLTVMDDDGDAATEVEPFDPGVEHAEFAVLTAEVTDTHPGHGYPREVEFVYELDQSEARTVTFTFEVDGSSETKVVEGTEGTHVVGDAADGNPNTEIATVTADIEDGEEVSGDITEDDGVVDLLA